MFYSGWLFGCLSAWLSVCLPACVFVHLCVALFVCVFMGVCVCVFCGCLFVCLFVCSCICLRVSVCLTVSSVLGRCPHPSRARFANLEYNENIQIGGNNPTLTGSAAWLTGQSMLICSPARPDCCMFVCLFWVFVCLFICSFHYVSLVIGRTTHREEYIHIYI